MSIPGIYQIYVSHGVRVPTYFLRQSTGNDGGELTASCFKPTGHNKIRIMDTKPVGIKLFTNLILFLQNQELNYLMSFITS